MITKINQKKWLKVLFTFHCSLFISVALMSCADDYNTVPQSSLPAADQTLWQNISENDQLQQFAKILQKTGYADELQNSKVYTVWAPLDNTYDAEALLDGSNDEVLSRFVKNHIACYSHVAKTNGQERIYTLNGKSYAFSADSYGEQALADRSLPCVNGVLHTIHGRQQFYPNLYEHIMTATGIDSVQSYFKRFERTYLDEKASILGPVVGGRQTYVDSVMVTTNNLFGRLRAYIQVEDSSYTALLPTDKAWIKAYDRIRPYFRYGAKTVSEDLSVENINTKKTRNIDAQLFGDSLTRNAIMANIFFNNNDYYNKWLVDEAYTLNTDTLLSTGRTLLPNGPELISQTIEQQRMSNGVARQVDSLAFTTDTWAPEITIAGINGSTRPRLLSAMATNVRIDDPEELNVEKGEIVSYVDLIPTGTRSLPDVYFYLPNILSTTYEIYAVIVPADIKKGYEGDVKPNKFLATLTYCDANGNLRTETLGEQFINDPSKVDYVLLGTKTFPIAYRGLGSEYHPSLELKANLRIFNKEEMDTYDRELRIAAIVLKPVKK